MHILSLSCSCTLDGYIWDAYPFFKRVEVLHTYLFVTFLCSFVFVRVLLCVYVHATFKHIDPEQDLPQQDLV